MKPGDIWLARIPSHLQSHEQSGTRPVIIVARVAKEIVTVIPCTSNLKALRFPFTYRLEPMKSNGLSQTTIALIFHMRGLDIRFFDHKIGVLNRTMLADIKKQAHRLIN